ncbi:MAG: hydroxymethylglutaryl-CoA lyase [Deltaproteobacteria bacterium]|nr:hydroxymethylglutaryl-CoA lyase [Deltaproteobacteria bacterium]
MDMPGPVRLLEVCLRDGLQNEETVVPTDVKVEIAHRLVAAGFRDLEVTSFVRPRLIPQLSDAAEVIRRLPQVEGVRFWALVPNQVGLERALDAGVRYIATVLSASETHNQKNVNRTVRESLTGLQGVIGTAVAHGVSVRGYVSTVFGCPYEGDVAVARSIELAKALLEAGASEIALGDTTGMANPEQVKSVLAAFTDAGIPIERIALHFHDTRGTAAANAYAGWQAGARMFDGSLSGVGGCPYAPGAAGNAATEDLVNLFESIGVETGIDLEAAAEIGNFLEEVLGRRLPGRYHQYFQGAGTRRAARSA